MTRSQRRLLAFVVGLATLLLVAALLYMLGMNFIEGESRGFWRSLEFAAETLSTTGYGADETWKSPVMVLFVVVLQFLGVFLIFLIFPVYLIPFLEERFEVRLPKEAPDISDHVIVFRFGPAVSTLLRELEQAGLKTVVVESDEAKARRLQEDGYTVVFGTLDDDVLAGAHLESARSLIANGTDDENAAVILGARQMGFTGEIVALVEDPFHRQPIVLAGATAAFTPRHMLGAALAADASQKVSPTVAGTQQLGKKLLVSEVRINRDSAMAGKTLAEIGLSEKTGVTVIGQWVGGELETPPSAEMRLQPDGIVIAAGSAEGLRRFEEICGGTRLRRRPGPIIVAGCGEVGSKVVQLLRDVGEELVVIDRVEGEGVDVVGDVLDTGVLEEAGVSSAQAVVLALDTDSATLFATVILKELAPDVPVIARVNRAVNVERIHRAGATYALSISQISGQILARRLLGEESIAVDSQLKVLKVSAKGLEGSHPSELGIRERTGCSVVAVERGDELLTQFGSEFVFEPNDDVYVCGSSKATRVYGETFPQG
jgi:Trk K+ transport system NAD-binding subunit